MNNKKQKADRQSWSEVNMNQAIEAVRSKKMGWLLASKTFSVPKSTLRRRVDDKNKILRGSKKGFLGGSVKVFVDEVEMELVNHVKSLESRFFGLTCSDLRKLSFQLAEKLKCKNNFNKEKRMAGWDWLHAFLKRHPSISLRQPEATSLARAQAFNKVTISKYFTALKIIMDKHKFEPDQIYNMDESGLSTVQSRTDKILATKGRKQVGTLTSAERGQHFTVVCSINALGNYIPPAIIFPRKNMKQELLDHAPPGCVGFPQESGWMTGQVFLLWLNHFIKFAKPSAERKILLLLDGHSSHKSLDVLEFAKKNNIILFCFPPHCTHRVQPLDVAFYGPLTTYYNQALRKWLHTHPGRTVTHFQVGHLFREAYTQAATVANAVHGFQKTGICPFNEDIFPDWQFLPSETTNLGEDNYNLPSTSGEQSQSSVQEGFSSQIETSYNDEFAKDEQPSQGHEELEKTASPGNNQDAINCSVLISQISPIPQVTSRQKRKRKGGEMGVLNTTPNIDTAKANIADKNIAELRKSARSAKRVLALEENDTELEEPFEADEGEDDPACIYCNSLFSLSRPKEAWIQCQQCKKWCHNECAGIDRKRKMFTCELCND